VCFDSEGRLEFHYNSFAKGCGLPPIDSCYALNAATTADTWVYYYTKFPLVHLRGKELADYWPDNPVRSSSAFAVAEGRALFLGSNYKQKDRFFLLSLAPIAVQEVGIVDDQGDTVLPKPTYHSCFGRAERLYIVADRGLFVVDLSELAFS
jgi:hypothetical protein